MWPKDIIRDKVMSRVNQGIQEELAQFGGEAITPNLIEVIKCKVENLLHNICMEEGDDIGRYIIEIYQSEVDRCIMAVSIIPPKDEAKTYAVPAQINKNAKWDDREYFREKKETYHTKMMQDFISLGLTNREACYCANKVSNLMRTYNNNSFEGYMLSIDDNNFEGYREIISDNSCNGEIALKSGRVVKYKFY